MLIVDPHIITACKKGDRRAQNELYRLCYPFLMKICRQYTHDDQDAASFLNEGFMKILTNLDKWTGQGVFYSWMKKVMVHTLIDGFRRSRKYKEAISLKEQQELHMHDQRTDTNWADQQIDAEALLALVRKLPEMSSKVFNLFASEGMDYREIGELLGIHENTAKWHVFAARKKLKEWIYLQMHHKQEVRDGTF